MQEILLWCFKIKYFLSAAHIPGKHNIEADRFSRKFNKIQNGNLISEYLLKLLISLVTQKLILLLPE